MAEPERHEELRVHGISDASGTTTGQRAKPRRGADQEPKARIDLTGANPEVGAAITEIAAKHDFGFVDFDGGEAVILARADYYALQRRVKVAMGVIRVDPPELLARIEFAIDLLMSPDLPQPDPQQIAS